MNNYGPYEIQILQTLLKIRQTKEQIALHLELGVAQGLQIDQLREYKADLERQLFDLLAQHLDVLGPLPIAA